MTADEQMAAMMRQYTDSFKQQVEKAGGRPVSFVFPSPASSIEQVIFSMFIAQMEKATGKKLKFTTQPGTA